ncbi:MAG: fumarylacetoacetate hydrolase family protein [Deinococcota bacterium]
MKLVSLQDQRLAVITDQGAFIPDAASDAPTTLNALLTGGVEARTALEAFVGQASNPIDEASLSLAACVPNPGKIVCVGLNYRRHAAEAGMAVPETPILFSKYANSLAAHGDAILIPDVTDQADYEAELAIVIGQRAQRVAEEDALSYVFGYCTANDLSARDLQMLTGQWLLGKTLDGFLPLGPYLVTADEISDPNALQIRAWLNGDLRQDSNTSDMVFSVEEIISYVSHYMTLEPGDVILTGTPEGVIFGDDPAVWLKDGDEVVIEVEKLGQLRNSFYQQG